MDDKKKMPPGPEPLGLTLIIGKPRAKFHLSSGNKSATEYLVNLPLPLFEQIITCVGDLGSAVRLFRLTSKPLQYFITANPSLWQKISRARVKIHEDLAALPRLVERSVDLFQLCNGGIKDLVVCNLLGSKITCEIASFMVKHCGEHLKRLKLVNVQLEDREVLFPATLPTLTSLELDNSIVRETTLWRTSSEPEKPLHVLFKSLETLRMTEPQTFLSCVMLRGVQMFNPPHGCLRVLRLSGTFNPLRGQLPGLLHFNLIQLFNSGTGCLIEDLELPWCSEGGSSGAALVASVLKAGRLHGLRKLTLNDPTLVLDDLVSQIVEKCRHFVRLDCVGSISVEGFHTFITACPLESICLENFTFIHPGYFTTKEGRAMKTLPVYRSCIEKPGLRELHISDYPLRLVSASAEQEKRPLLFQDLQSLLIYPNVYSHYDERHYDEPMPDQMKQSFICPQLRSLEIRPLEEYEYIIPRLPTSTSFECPRLENVKIDVACLPPVILMGDVDHLLLQDQVQTRLEEAKSHLLLKSSALSSLRLRNREEVDARLKGNTTESSKEAVSYLGVMSTILRKVVLLIPGVDELYLDAPRMSQCDVYKADHLRRLYLRSNQLRGLPLSKWGSEAPGLKHLESALIDCPRLESLVAGGCESLTSITIRKRMHVPSSIMFNHLDLKQPCTNLERLVFEEEKEGEEDDGEGKFEDKSNIKKKKTVAASQVSLRPSSASPSPSPSSSAVLDRLELDGCKALKKVDIRPGCRWILSPKARRGLEYYRLQHPNQIDIPFMPTVKSPPTSPSTAGGAANSVPSPWEEGEREGCSSR